MTNNNNTSPLPPLLSVLLFDAALFAFILLVGINRHRVSHETAAIRFSVFKRRQGSGSDQTNSPQEPFCCFVLQQLQINLDMTDLYPGPGMTSLQFYLIMTARYQPSSRSLVC